LDEERGAREMGWCQESVVSRCRPETRGVSMQCSNPIACTCFCLSRGCPHHPLVAERRTVGGLRTSKGEKQVGRSFLFPFSPVPRHLLAALEGGASGAPCFRVPKSPAHGTLVPGPTEAGHWPSFFEVQFQRTIIGPLLIPASATPGGLSPSWTGDAWQGGGDRPASSFGCQSRESTAPTWNEHSTEAASADPDN
jgi:hypothetical protein